MVVGNYFKSHGTNGLTRSFINETNTQSSNVIADNSFVTDGSLGTASLESSGANTVIRNNLGYNPQGPASITVGASPFTYTAGSTPETVYIGNGSISSVVKNGITLLVDNGAVNLEPHETIIVTYTGSPFMIKDRH